MNRLTIGFTVLLWMVGANIRAQQTAAPDYYADSRNEMGIATDIPTILKGEDNFNQHCASCHSLCQQRLGPPLAGVTDRRPVAWLLDFINDSQAVIENGDPYANFLFKRYRNMIMPEFTFLEESEIMAILAYFQEQSSAPNPVAGANSQPLIDAEDIDVPKQAAVPDIMPEIEKRQKKFDSWKPFFKYGLIVFGIFSFVITSWYVFFLWKKG